MCPPPKMAWCAISSGNSASPARPMRMVAGGSQRLITNRNRLSSALPMFLNVPSSSTTERLSGIFRDVFDDETINIRDDMTSQDIEAWDSLMHIDLIFAIE